MFYVYVQRYVATENLIKFLEVWRIKTHPKQGLGTCNAWHWHWHWLARQRHACMSRNAATGQLTQPALFRFARLAERDSQQERGTGIGEDRGEQLLLLPTEDRRFPQLRIRAMSRATLVALAWRCWCAIRLALEKIAALPLMASRSVGLMIFFTVNNYFLWIWFVSYVLFFVIFLFEEEEVKLFSNEWGA
jgi:hypothetical protein